MSRPDRSDYIAFEGGYIGFDREVLFFQYLIDTGELAGLGPRYQERARELIEAGYIEDVSNSG
jgi:hypothetical protein